MKGEVGGGWGWVGSGRYVRHVRKRAQLARGSGIERAGGGSVKCQLTKTQRLRRMPHCATQECAGAWEVQPNVCRGAEGDVAAWGRAPDKECQMEKLAHGVRRQGRGCGCGAQGQLAVYRGWSRQVGSDGGKGESGGRRGRPEQGGVCSSEQGGQAAMAVCSKNGGSHC